MQHIARFNDRTDTSVVFTATQASTGGFQFAMHSGAMLQVTATSTGSPVVLTFGTRPNAASTQFFTAADSSNAPVTLTVQADRCYAVPDAVFAATYVTATAAAGATVTCNVYLKG
jgi:hypothetical protein